MRIAAGLVLIAGVFASSAHAVDGVFEINEACATGSGCFAGDTAGLPVQITGPGTYRLTGNLPVGSAAVTAIVVSTVSVTIDLNGFAIVGPNLCSGCPVTSCNATGPGHGIDVVVAANVVIRNGTIRGMGGSGIRGRGTIENMVLEQNGGLGVFATSTVTVKDSTASSNGGVGISSGGGILSGNTVACNKGNGMQLFAGSVIGNHAAQNGGDGINVTSEGAILNNNANNNAACGIRASRSQVSSNTVDNNGACGITVTTSGMVIGNTLDSNGLSSGSGPSALNLAPSVGLANNQLRNHPGSCPVVGGRETGHNVCNAIVSCPFAYCPFFDPVCGPCIP